MPQDLPPVETKSEEWLAYLLKEHQSRQVDVNKENIRAIEALAKRVLQNENTLHWLRGVLWVVGSVVSALVLIAIALFVKRS